MKRLLVFAMAASMVLSLAVISQAQLTGDEIIAKYLENSGGLENYKNLKSMKMEGKAFIGEMVGDLTISRKSPAGYHMLWQAEQYTVLVASDGKKIWQQLPMVPGYIFAEEADLPKQLEGMLFNPYLDYRERGAKAKYVGDEQVKGLDSYKVEYIQASGDTNYLYFDKTNFSLLREAGAEGDQIFEKYKVVDGFNLPFKMTTQQGPQRIMMVITSYAINPALPDSLFIAPPDSLAAPPEVMQAIKQQQEAMKKAAQEEKAAEEQPAADTTAEKKTE